MWLGELKEMWQRVEAEWDDVGLSFAADTSVGTQGGKL